jgi:ABC-type amino acid transport substrate-binding protein
MKFSHLLLVVVLSAAMGYAAAQYAVTHNGATPAKSVKETSYDRVLRTQTLRCGYEYWDGGIMKDEKTGAVYGPWVDIMNAIGAATGLKIEWASQVGWSDVGAALKSGKIDAMCAGMWTSAAKAKEISFSTPLSYQALEAFARADDHRFDGGLDSLNDSGVKLGVIENDNSDFIAEQDFPRAQKDSLGSLNGTDSELMMQVMTGKADATFVAPGLWRQFDKANPDKIRRLAPEKKLRAFGNAIAVDKADQDWPDMFIKPMMPFP